MSLVEQALKRVQQSHAVTEGAEARTSSPPVVIGRVVPSADPGGLDAGSPATTGRKLLIDREALRAAGLLPPQNQERQIADEYRHVKRPLIANAFGRGSAPVESGRLIMLASALSGDGKTFTSINLAMSIAQEKDISVLLVDADVAKPHISKLFGVDKERGLLDVLREPAMNIEDVILPTDIRGLTVLPAGSPSENATELLASDRMRQVMQRLLVLDGNRIVLCDSPPLLVTSESRVLATLMGQIVLVVCADRTPQRAVFDSLDLLGEGKSVGIVLNQGDEHSGSYDYGYSGRIAEPGRAAQ